MGYAGTYAHPGADYFAADRGQDMYLNLIDSPDPAYIAPEAVRAGVDFIGRQLDAGRTVVVHCDQGKSRAPSIALLYLAGQGMTLADFERLMPEYHPGLGMRLFVARHWAEYQRPVGSDLGSPCA